MDSQLPTIYLYNFGKTRRGLSMIGNTTRIGYDNNANFIGFKRNDFLEAATQHHTECLRLKGLLIQFKDIKYYDQLLYHVGMYEIMRQRYLDSFWYKKVVVRFIIQWYKFSLFEKVIIQTAGLYLITWIFIELLLLLIKLL